MSTVSFMQGQLDGLVVKYTDGRLRVTADLPIYARSEPNTRGHWAKKHARAAEQRMASRMILGLARFAISDVLANGRGLRITLTRIRPESRAALDDDNLNGALKAVRDGVADAIGVKSDADPRLTWDYAQSTADDYGVRIEISDAAVVKPRAKTKNNRTKGQR